ncbi:hypothetical protein BLNAU_8100 [Blattamonas nauphoetae]|uniref:Protein kinase domain-containing protein n=1 Tax=Blattamonas nauphoetae TaxID=2049346 RepID=A0ABQ9XZY1_9EUKA|nr:hypothetical protein BLNAU_8100 [Blattamonas nauphoetae]
MESKSCRISFSFSRTPRHGCSSLATISSSSVRIYESRVISNSERTPFVVVGENGWEETSISLIGCSHTSSCFPSLLPLASLESRSASSASPFDVDVAQNVEIASHGLWIRDASLIVGTGPLFDFCGFGSQLERKETCFVKTTLSSSCILNTTSDFTGSVARERKAQDGGSDVGLVSGVSQLLIGSCVSSCTNHLYGTAIHDLNLGGSVLCQNTSFTHTTSTLDYHNEHKTQQTELKTQNVLHRFSLCTFKDGYAGGSAGAIHLYNSDADLEIESCSFDSCTAGFAGGALYITTINGQSTFTLLSTSFVGCKSNSGKAGSLLLSQSSLVIISDTIFRNSNSTAGGGAMTIYQWNAQSSRDAISNCLFMNCRTTASSYGGGGIEFSHCSSIHLESVSFRECTSSTNTGYDMFFDSSDTQTYPHPTVSLSTVSNCDSTSTPTITSRRIHPTNIVSGTVLPTPSQTATIQSLTAQLSGSTEAEMVVILNKAVSGRLLLLVSNAQGKSRTDKSKAPNIDRVLAFTLSSNVGQMAVSIGETGLLQLPLEDYRIGAASLSGYNVSFSTTPITVVTLNPTLLSANCVLDESHTKIVLNLEGSDMDGNTFVFTLHDKSTFEATFASSKASVTLELTGEGAEWKENMMFVIVSGKKKNSDSISVSIPTPCFFTIPEGPRLTNVEVSELNEDKTGVTLSFTSRQLKGDEDFEVTIQKVGGDETKVMTLSTDSEGQIISQTVVLFPSGSNTEGWKNWIVFGESYKVVGVSWKRSQGDVAVQFSSIGFDMPVEVVRVSSADCSKDSATSTIVSIVGVGFVVDETYTLTLSGTPTSDSTSSDSHTATITVKATTQTAAQSSALSLSASSEESLRFGFTYEITAITNGTVDGVVKGGEFDTPSEPSVTSISRKLKDGDAKTIEISISGSNIPDGLYNLVLKKTGSTKETDLPIKFVGSTGKVEIEVFSSSALEYGATYEVLSLSSSSLRVALPKEPTDRSLTMPDTPARVMSVSCELSGELKTHAKIVISGEKLPSGKTLSVKVKEVDPTGILIESEIELSEMEITSEESTEPIEIEVYEVTNPCLKFGKTYELISLAISDTSSCILDESVRFSVPCKPVRVTSASCTDTNPNWTVVTVEGSEFVTGGFYTVTLSGTPTSDSTSSDSHTATITVKATTQTAAQSSALSLSASSEESLRFGFTYEITAITNGTEAGVVKGGEFDTPSEPSVTSISRKLKDGDAKTIEISISGSNIPDGLYNLVLKKTGSTKETDLPIKFVGSTGKVEIEVFSSSALEYGATYEVLSLSSSSLRVALPKEPTDRSLTMPDTPARVMSVSCELSGELKTHAKIVISGANLPSGKTLSVKVKEVDPTGSLIGSEIELPETEITSEESTEPIEIEVYEASEPCLKFGKTYELISLAISDTSSCILDESVRFSVPCKPVRVTSASCTDTNPNWTVVTVEGSEFVTGGFYTVTLSGTPTSDSTSSDSHTATITVKATTQTAAQSSALSLSASSEESLRFGFTYEITAITNGTEAGVVKGGEFDTPSEPSVTSISRKLKDGDAKTIEISISGSNIPDGLYNLVLKKTGSTKETDLPIKFVGSTGKVEIEVFSSSALEYGATYEVLSLSSSSLRVALPKEPTDRSLTMPDTPARVMSVSCELSGELKTHAKIVISGANLPSGKTLSVKVKEVDPTGSLIGSEIELPETEITSEESTEPIEIEVYEASEPCLKFGKTYELISLAISDTASCILDESVRFSVPIEPVRVTSASCTDTNPNWTVVTVKGSGFVSGEFYTVTVYGSPINSPSPPPSPLHEASFVVTASSDQLATSSALQLYPVDGRLLRYLYSYTITKITNGTEDGVIHSGVFETREDIERDEGMITKTMIVPANSLNASMIVELSGSNLPSGTVGSMTLNDSFTFDVSFSSDTFGRSEVIALGVSGSLAFGKVYKITELCDSNMKKIEIEEAEITTLSKPSKLSFYVCGTEASAGVDHSGADPETCFGIKSAWNSATSLGISDTAMRIVTSADLTSPLVVTTSVPFTLLSFQSEPATLQARPSASQPNCVLVSVKEEAECRLTLLTVIADLSGSSFKLVSASKGTVVIRSCSIEGRGGSGSNNEDVSICGWSRGFIELIETDTELNGVTLKGIEVGGIWMRGGKLNVTAGVFSQNGPSITDFPSARQNIHCEGEGMLVIDSLAKGDGTKNHPSAWIDATDCLMAGDEDIIEAPLFIPTLLPNSSSSFNSSSNQYRIVVVGSSLFPCGLSLEVSSQKGDKRESVEFALSGSSDGFSSFSESEIVVTLASSSLSSLHTSEEWKGCLLFGNNQSSSSFVIRSPSSDQKQAEGGVTSRGWIVGLVVGIGILALIVILLLVVLGLRSRASKKGKTPNQSEMEETDQFEVKVDDVNELNRHSGDTSFYGMGSKSIVVESSASDFTQLAHSNAIRMEGDDLQEMVEVMNGENPVSVTQLTRNCSLYNRLHGTNPSGFSRMQVGLELARGVEQIAKTDSSAPILTTLSPHWIFLDSKDKVFFQTKAALTQGAFFGSGLGESTEKARNRERVEDQRWQAPEMVKGGVVAEMEKAAVFSLGILLWELETGEIPCKEVDAVNAQRAFGSGFQLNTTTITNKILAELIDKCVTPDVDSRPSLSEIVKTLEGLEENKQPAEVKLDAESTKNPPPAI